MSFQPSALSRGGASSAENVYEIDESTAMENETVIPPSAGTDHTGGNEGHASNVNGNVPRALPSIHLYADVSLPNNAAFISPTSDYGSTEEIVNGNGVHSNARSDAAAEGGGDESSNKERGKRFYFILENSENGSDPAPSSTGLHEFSTACEPDPGRKSPICSPGSSLKGTLDRGLAATNHLYAGASGVDLGEYANETRGDEADSGRGYINSDFHDVPKNMKDNSLYKPTPLDPWDTASEAKQFQSPQSNIPSRSNSESASSPRSPLYANSVMLGPNRRGRTAFIGERGR